MEMEYCFADLKIPLTPLPVFELYTPYTLERIGKYAVLA